MFINSYNLGDMAHKFLPDNHRNYPTMSEIAHLGFRFLTLEGRSGPSDADTKQCYTTKGQKPRRTNSLERNNSRDLSFFYFFNEEGEISSL